MRKRGFDTQEIAEKLHAKGIEVKTPTLAKYLNEFRQNQARKTDRPAPQKRTAKPQAEAAKPTEKRAEATSQPACTPGSFIIKPDTPLDEL